MKPRTLDDRLGSTRSYSDIQRGVICSSWHRIRFPDCEPEWIREPKRRVRWLTHDEAARLLSELPPHLAEMARFSLATGLREANVTGLSWTQVDLERRVAWIHADQSKNQKPLPVPLNADAVLVVLCRQVGQHPTWVFTFQGHPVGKANNHAWRKALVRAGITDFR